MGLELVDYCMAPRADGDEPADFVHAGPTVVDGRLVPCPAASLATLAVVAIALEHLLANAGKVNAGVPAPGVTRRAASGNGGRTAAIGAKQPFLREVGHNPL